MFPSVIISEFEQNIFSQYTARAGQAQAARVSVCPFSAPVWGVTDWADWADITRTGLSLHLPHLNTLAGWHFTTELVNNHPERSILFNVDSK